MRYWIASFTTPIASNSRATACAGAPAKRKRPEFKSAVRPTPHDQGCRRARASQGQALRVAAKTRPALTGPARDGCERCGRDGRMLAARVEPKNEPKRIGKPTQMHNAPPSKASRALLTKPRFPAQ